MCNNDMFISMIIALRKLFKDSSATRNDSNKL